MDSNSTEQYQGFNKIIENTNNNILNYNPINDNIHHNIGNELNINTINGNNEINSTNPDNTELNNIITNYDNDITNNNIIDYKTLKKSIDETCNNIFSCCKGRHNTNLRITLTKFQNICNNVMDIASNLNNIRNLKINENDFSKLLSYFNINNSDYLGHDIIFNISHYILNSGNYINSLLLNQQTSISFKDIISKIKTDINNLNGFIEYLYKVLLPNTIESSNKNLANNAKLKCLKIMDKTVKEIENIKDGLNIYNILIQHSTNQDNFKQLLRNKDFSFTEISFYTKYTVSYATEMIFRIFELVNKLDGNKYAQNIKFKVDNINSWSKNGSTIEHLLDDYPQKYITLRQLLIELALRIGKNTNRYYSICTNLINKNKYNNNNKQELKEAMNEQLSFWMKTIIPLQNILISTNKLGKGMNDNIYNLLKAIWVTGNNTLTNMKEAIRKTV